MMQLCHEFFGWLHSYDFYNFIFSPNIQVEELYNSIEFDDLEISTLWEKALLLLFKDAIKEYLLVDKKDSQEDLKTFVKFITGQNVYAGDKKIKMHVISKGGMPFAAHTCFYTLDVFMEGIFNAFISDRLKGVTLNRSLFDISDDDFLNIYDITTLNDFSKKSPIKKKLLFLWAADDISINKTKFNNLNEEDQKLVIAFFNGDTLKEEETNRLNSLFGKQDVNMAVNNIVQIIKNKGVKFLDDLHNNLAQKTVNDELKTDIKKSIKKSIETLFKETTFGFE